MAKQTINIGTIADDGTGSTIRAGGDIANDNFNELYTLLGNGTTLYSLTFPNATDTVVGRATTDTLTNKTLTSAIVGTSLDLNASELILDADADTSITADTDDQIDIKIGGNDRITLQSGIIDLKNDGSESQLKLYCESSNAHAQTVQGAPHSESASNTLTLPSTGGDARLVSTTSTATLTNKTLTSPKINEDVAVTATATEINLLDGVTSTTSELNILDGVTSTASELNLVDGSSAGTIANSKAVIYGSSGEVNATTLQIAGTSITSTAAELNILDGVTATATELNIMDGDTSATSTTLADADRVVTNDNGTMKQVALSDVKTYLSSAGFSTEDPTALAIALG